MKSVNRVTLLGSVGKTPEAKFTPGGVAVTKFSLATNEKYKDKSQQWVEKTSWHNIVVWAKLAEIASEYLTKGSKVYIEGKITYDSWDDKASGEKKYRTEIVATEIVLLDSKQETQSSSESEQQDNPF